MCTGGGSCCEAGEKKCVGSNAYQTCQSTTSDLCGGWSGVTNCGSGQTCNAGNCTGGVVCNSSRNYSLRNGECCTPGNNGGYLCIISEIDVPGTDPEGLTWDGSSLWNANGSRIYKINPTTGAVITSFSSPTANPSGLTYIGNNTLVISPGGFSPSDRTLYFISTSNGSTTNSCQLGEGNIPSALTWDGTRIWEMNQYTSGVDNTIYKLNTNCSVASSIISPVDYFNGGHLAWDGQNPWYNHGVNSLIYKFSASGSILNVFNAPHDNSTGLTFDSNGNIWSISDHIYKLHLE